MNFVRLSPKLSLLNTRTTYSMFPLCVDILPIQPSAMYQTYDVYWTSDLAAPLHLGCVGRFIYIASTVYKVVRVLFRGVGNSAESRPHGCRAPSAASQVCGQRHNGGDHHNVPLTAEWKVLWGVHSPCRVVFYEAYVHSHLRIHPPISP